MLYKHRLMGEYQENKKFYDKIMQGLQLDIDRMIEEEKLKNRE